MTNTPHTFQLEWTGKVFGDNEDHDRAITAAQLFCEKQGLDPDFEYNYHLQCIECWGDGNPDWEKIETAALDALGFNVENVTLVWA